MPALSGNSGKDSGKQEMTVMANTKSAAAHMIKNHMCGSFFSIYLVLW